MGAEANLNAYSRPSEDKVASSTTMLIESPPSPCSIFTRPPLDCSLTLPEVYEWHAKYSSRHPAYVLEESPGKLRTIVWEEVMQGVRRATAFVKKAVGDAGLARTDDGNAPVISILAALGALRIVSEVTVTTDASAF